MCVWECERVNVRVVGIWVCGCVGLCMWVCVFVCVRARHVGVCVCVMWVCLIATAPRR